VSVPVGDVKSAFDNGVNGEAFLLINLAGLPLRLNLNYQKLDLKTALQEAQQASTIIAGTGGLHIDLLRGPVRPYLFAGLGAFSIENSTEGSASETQFKFGVDGGAGLSLMVGPFELFLEGRVQNVYTDNGIIDFKSITMVPVSFGIIL
jgi:hypothetical protein